MVRLSNRADQTWRHNLLSLMTSQLVSKTKVITITKHLLKWDTFLKKWAIPSTFSFIFGLFQTNNTISTTNQCEKMSSPSSIRCRDSNPRPLDRESPPITTRPGLPPLRYLFKYIGFGVCLEMGLKQLNACSIDFISLGSGSISTNNYPNSSCLYIDQIWHNTRRALFYVMCHGWEKQTLCFLFDHLRYLFWSDNNMAQIITSQIEGCKL